MKHFVKTVALACAALASSANAEGLSTYALVDGGLASQRITGGASAATSKTEFMTGSYVPSLVGMVWEKSSGGLTSGIHLEQGFTLNPAGSSNGFAFADTSTFMNREANVFLKSNSFGSLTVGTQLSQQFLMVVNGDARGAANLGSGTSQFVARGSNVFDDVAINYTTPSMGGLTLTGVFVPEANNSYNATNSTNIKTGNRFAANYTKDSLTAGLATYSNTVYTAATTTGTNSGTVGALSYKLGDATAKAVFANQSNLGSKSTHVGFGGNYSISAATVVDAGIYHTSGDSNYKVDTTAVGIQHALNKEYKVYAQWAQTANKGTSSGLVLSNLAAPVSTSPAVGAGQTNNTIAAGIILSLSN
jgi:predicted porin